MSQNSTIIPNSDGLTFRTNLNNALDTVTTLKSGSSAPSSPYAGWFWFDTVNDKLFVRNSANTAWKAQLIADFQGTNIQHSIRNSRSWIYNEDGAVTGALQLKINGLYSQTLSGGIIVSVSQNSTTDGTYIDYEFYIAGNWRSSDHTWHNTKAIMRSATLSASMNVRFCSNATDVFLVIGDTSTAWNYPRIVIKDMVSNAIVVGYNPDFTITRVTSYPTTTQSTIATTTLDMASSIHSATSKSTPVDADQFGIADSAASFGFKKITFLNLYNAIQTKAKTYFDGIYASLSNIKTVNGVSIIGTGDIVASLPQNSQTFTASGTFAVPDGVTKVMVSMAHAGAGGGGGGYGASGDKGADGGGGSASVFSAPKILTVTPLDNITVIIGAGGAGGAGDTNEFGNASNGGPGGTTSFGALTAFGSSAVGLGGESPSGGAGGGGGGAGVFCGSAGAVATPGGSGGTATGGFTTGFTQATGGSPTTPGTGGTSDGNNGADGTHATSYSGGNGGAGGNSLVIVYY